MDAGRTKSKPSSISVSSPTNAVEVSGNFKRHLSTMTSPPATGPIEKPARSAGSSENCTSRNDGNMKGRLNFARYSANASAVSKASLATYAAEIFQVIFFFPICITPPWDAKTPRFTQIEAHGKDRFPLLPSGLYRRYGNFTRSACNASSRTLTAGEELHLAPKQSHHIPAPRICQRFGQTF